MQQNDLAKHLLLTLPGQLQEPPAHDRGGHVEDALTDAIKFLGDDGG